MMPDGTVSSDEEAAGVLELFPWWYSLLFIGYAFLVLCMWRVYQRVQVWLEGRRERQCGPGQEGDV